MYKSKMVPKGACVIAAAMLAMSGESAAQTPAANGARLPPASVPNAGSILQQKKSESSELGVPGQGIGEAPAVQKEQLLKRYQVKSVRFSGNSRVPQEELEAMLQPYVGKAVSAQELEQMADLISELYRAHGYGFTFTSVDQGSLADGNIRFIIVEGTAGKISLKNQSRVHDALLEGMMARFRAHPEDTDSLERASLLIGDTPGVGAARPRLSRGTTNGAVDVEMDVQPAPLVNGAITLDNYGSRTSGRTRLGAMLNINSPFGWGDVLRLNVSGLPFNLQSGDSTLGGVTYDFPLGHAGLRGGVGYNRLQYNLGGLYAGQFDGTADVWSAYMSYPIVRQQTRNLAARVSYSHNLYRDNQVSFENKRNSDTFAFMLYGNLQDSLLGLGAANRASLTLTYGVLRYDSPLFAQQDAAGSKTAGGYTKAELSLSRMQQLSRFTYVQADIQGQYAFKNLDGSARLVTGGPSAVRAFSSDFVSVDTGVVARATVGWRLPVPLPTNAYVFYDVATGILRHDPLAGQSNNVNLKGLGLGLDMTWRSVTASLSYATRVGGSAPGLDNQPRSWLWASLGYSF
ncbi:TPA: ShlB/FhaC/HecB family hemolysin secretion/activation protein [Burkholderia orbicola]|uniref:ShlB/FhaC/HecB family hemolysin secretion/activation protein n=1 Tax=Burkholderia orbicola TaxID=2978683 RepID=UPI000F5A5895|nr:ShlB/FhaC/HecB family hemolysin secretion/activation protein [Burkholderia orbicola]MDN7535505.1 ShlB/FhaC/HecB family hemolysin secretion/activation protein [Burkholderia orbicola]RQV01716.1 ShlB/FhaC/HecB family hemolysin secretion/activation protein [Burkholderia cenocepacia]